MEDREQEAITACRNNDIILKKGSATKLLTREELEDRIQQLEARNFQLENLLKSNRSSNSLKYPQVQKSRSFDFSQHSKRHILLKFLYLGWDRHGFAVQENLENTVESVLFDALLKTKLIESRETSNYHRCGRTDKGVTAFDQVISITVRSALIPKISDAGTSTDVNDTQEMERQEINFCKILNRVLPLDIRILAWSPVHKGFSARFDCVSRTYKYFFPLGNLSLQNMRKAADYLIGVHDYRNFCKMDVGNGVVNFVRKITSFTISEVLSESRHHKAADACHTLEDETIIEDELCTKNEQFECASIDKGYRMCVATITGTAFLWHQIRAIMSVIFLVGEGEESPDVVQKMLDVEAVPRKPQYGLAREIALNLYSTKFNKVEWHYDHDNLQKVIAQFQMLWAQWEIKSSMIKHMAQDLSYLFFQRYSEIPFSCQARYCLQEPQAKIYKPLLERPTCESLQERVRHFVKKSRLDKSVMKKFQPETEETIQEKNNT